MTEMCIKKAKRLVYEGRVAIWGETKHGTRAYVEDDIWYLVVLYPQGYYFCECSVGKDCFDTTTFCVHALAAQLFASQEE